MSMPDDFKAILVQAFTNNVGEFGLHTADPGTTGANDSEIEHIAITWGSITDGVVTALIEIAGLTGEYTHIGLWDGETFRQGIPCRISYAAPADIAVLLMHEVGEDVSLI